MKEHHFIERFWYPSRSFRSLFYYTFWIFNLPFLLLVKLKYFLYQNKILKSNSFSKPIIVVGNLTVGGTGKTPFITNLVSILSEQGINSGIVSRGYHSEVKNYPHQVTDCDSASSVGDEAFMQFSNLKIPIVIDADRSRAANYLIENNNIDIIISDDGLQHYKMQRDLEIVLMDSSRAFGNRLILPLGPLREPISRCLTIDLLVKNGEVKVESDIENLVNEQVVIVPKQFVRLKDGEAIDLEYFNGCTVNAISGVGSPNRFYTTLKKLCTINETKTFSDHYQFSENDFDSLEHSKEDEIPIVMTEKDAVKCKPFAKDNWYYLKVTMKFDNHFANDLQSTIQALVERKSNG